MNQDQMRSRAKAFALRVIRATDALLRSQPAEVIGRQLLRAGTSIGANHRSACRARSRADFVAKVGIVEEEADERGYWLELLEDAALIKPSRLTELKEECDEITAIVVAGRRTARGNAPVAPGRRRGSAGLSIRDPRSAIRNA
jgi:four helix bundle protein